jgi:hypothetical protein
MNDFYVYAWLRQCGTPFYVGKGRGDRAYVYKRQNPIFDRIVKKMRGAGHEPTIVKWIEGICETDAFCLEQSYIRLFGRIDDRTGVLANMTAGGGGTSGKVVSLETRARQSASLKGKSPPLATRNAVAAANKTREWTDGRRKAMSLAVSARTPSYGFKGAVFYRRTGRWMSHITIDSKNKHLGYFDTAEDAARAYDKAAFEAWGHDCYLNFPSELIKDAA